MKNRFNLNLQFNFKLLLCQNNYQIHDNDKDSMIKGVSEI